MRLAWRRFGWESFRARFEGPRVELGARTLGDLQVDSLRIEAERLILTPGLPPRLEAHGLRVRVSIEQGGVDEWTRRRKLPFELRLGDDGLLVRTPRVGGEVHTELGIQRGWFVIRPLRAALLGLSTPVASFPIYLPLPTVSGGIALRTVEHAASGLHAHFDLRDVEERLSPGLSERLRARLLAT